MHENSHVENRKVPEAKRAYAIRLAKSPTGSARSEMSKGGRMDAPSVHAQFYQENIH